MYKILGALAFVVIVTSAGFKAGQNSERAKQLEVIQSIEADAKKKLQIVLEKKDAEKQDAIELQEQLDHIKRVNHSEIITVIEKSDCKRVGDDGLRLLRNITRSPK